MDWNDTPEQATFRQEVRSFIRDRLPAYYRKPETIRHKLEEPEDDWQMEMAHGSDEARAAATEWVQVMGDKGWTMPSFPTEYGGAGLSTMEQFILNMELAAADAPRVGGAHLGQIGPTLLIHGTEEQKRRFLPPSLKGELLWAQGYSEPGAGSDLASLQTRAIRDGDEFVVNGQKMWTSAGHKANWIFVLVRTDVDAPKHRGISFLLVDMSTPGISVRPIISMGWKHATNETFYEDVRVPVDQLVGELNRGWYVAMTLLDFERSAIAGAVAQRQVLDELVEQVKAGETPNRGKLMRGEIADRVVEVEVNNNLSMRIASMQARGMVPNYEASMGKAYSTELGQRIARTGMKTFGLYAGIWKSTDERAPLNAQHTHRYVDLVVMTIAGGSSEIQRNIIATRGLGLPRG